MSHVDSVWHLAHTLHIHEQVERGLEFRGQVYKSTLTHFCLRARVHITAHDPILLCLSSKQNQCKCTLWHIPNASVILSELHSRNANQSGTGTVCHFLSDWQYKQQLSQDPLGIPAVLLPSSSLNHPSQIPPYAHSLSSCLPTTTCLKKHPELTHGSHSTSAVHCQSTDSALRVQKQHLEQVYRYKEDML